MLKVSGFVVVMDDDLLSLDELLVGVQDPGVIFAHGDPQLVHVEVLHAVSRCQDVALRDSGTAAEMAETGNKEVLTSS